MSDLFHDSIDDSYIAAVFGVMAACPEAHVPGADEARGAPSALVSSGSKGWLLSCRIRRADGRRPTFASAQLLILASTASSIPSRAPSAPGLGRCKNVWLGVSVEDQQARRGAHPAPAAHAGRRALPVVRAAAGAGSICRKWVQTRAWLVTLLSGSDQSQHLTVRAMASTGSLRVARADRRRGRGNIEQLREPSAAVPRGRRWRRS